MGKWLKQVSASFVGKFALTAVSVIFSGAVFIESLKYIKAAPWPIIALFLLAILVLIVGSAFALKLWLFSPQTGSFQPRYLNRYRWPVLRVSWDFANFIGGTAGGGSPVLIHFFQAKIRINRGHGIVPKEAYIQSRNTGEKLPLLLDIKSSGNSENYTVLEQARIIPSGKWFQVSARFAESSKTEDALTKETLIKKFDGFVLALEYEGGSFRRSFTRGKMLAVIDNFWAYSSPPADDFVGLRS